MRYVRAVLEEMKDTGSPANETMFQRIVTAINEQIIEEQFLPSTWSNTLGSTGCSIGCGPRDCKP